MSKDLTTILIAVIFMGNSSGVEGSALRPLAAAISDNVKKIRLASQELDFEIEEFPEEVIEKLPEITSKGRRIAAVRTARGMKLKDVCKKANIVSSTYSTIEQSASLPTPEHLYNICKAIGIDPVRIIDGFSWNEVKSNLKDNEKMNRLRLRRGKTQEQIVEALKGAGLTFKTDDLDAQRSRYSNWESGKAKPLYGDRVIIAKTLGDDTLFDIPKEFKGDIELKIMPGMPISYKSTFRLAFYWRRVQGLTLTEAAKAIGITPDLLHHLMKQYDREKVARFYGIVLEKKRPNAPKISRKRTRKKKKTPKVPKITAKRPNKTAPPTAPPAVPSPLPPSAAPPYKKSPVQERTEKLKLILAGHPELDRPDKFLDYLNEREPDILEEVPEAKRIGLLKDILFFGYEIIPLPEEVLERLPGLGIGERVVAAREARKMEPEEVCAAAGISLSAYLKIEAIKGQDYIAPQILTKVFVVAEMLNVDMIFIIRGKSWDEIRADLKDNEKMFLLRLRRCWTQKKLVLGLEKAGLEFKADKMAAKESTVAGWEKGGRPQPEKRRIIRKVLGDNSLYREVYEAIAEEAEAGAPVLDQPGIAAEKLSKMKEYVEEIFSIIPETIDPFAKKGEEAGIERLFLVGDYGWDKQYYFILYSAYHAYKRLRISMPVVEHEDDIEEAIELLDDILEEKYGNIEDRLSQEPVSEQSIGLRRLWKATIYLRQMLKFSAATVLCDRNKSMVRELALELTEYLVEDSDKVHRIEDWVKRNIDFALGYGGYWDATASETIGFSRGICFNRANLIVAMLRSVGILSRYRIMRLKKEMGRDIITPERYQEMDETTEHIVAQAFVDGSWINLAGEGLTKDGWVELKDLEAEEIGKSDYADNIDSFALKKAEKDSRQERDDMENYRMSLTPQYHPDNIFETFKKEKGRISWNNVPTLWLKPDIRALVEGLAKLRGGVVKVLVELLSIDDFKEPVFSGGVSFSGLLGFIKEKYKFDTEAEAFYKIMEIAGIEKGLWEREDWDEVRQLIASRLPAAEGEKIKTIKDIEDHLYRHGLKEIEAFRLCRIMDGGKGNKLALRVFLTALYQEVEQYVNQCCEVSPQPLEPDQFIYHMLRELSRQLPLFDYKEENFSDFIARSLSQITEDYMGKISSGRESENTKNEQSASLAISQAA